MREIKFRIWTPPFGEDVEPVYPSVMSYPQNFGSDDYSFGWSCQDYLDVGSISQKPYSGDYRILMQYTGLKDKNGKEIYEGDIVNAPFRTGSKGLPSTKTRDFKVQIVYYTTRGFGLSHQRENPKYRFIPHLDECEVLGNIYENPELLNAKSI